MTTSRPLYRGVPTGRALTNPELRELARRIADELHARPPVLSLSVKHAAEAIGVGETFLRDLMDTGKLHYVKIEGRRVVRVADLEALLEKNAAVGRAS